MSDSIYVEEIPAYRQRGYFEVRNFRDQVVGLYHQDKDLYVNVVDPHKAIAYHPEMPYCRGVFYTPDGEVAYNSYAEYIDKIESAFKRAQMGWR